MLERRLPAPFSTPPLLRSLPLAACAILAAPAVAQSARNVTLQSVYTPAGVPAGKFADVWGYASPSGRELALLSGEPGVWVIECTDPRNPVERAFFANGLSGWSDEVPHDIRTFGRYAYVVTEGGGGMQILDLGNPDQPRLVTTWGQSLWSNAHNLAIDVERGIAYPCGTDVGVGVIDLQNPVAPRWLRSYGTSYVHDLFVQDGVAHMAEFNASRYVTVDVSALPAMAPLGAIAVPSAHSAWPTRDGRYAVTGSELPGGHLRIFDIANPRLPQQIASYRTGPAGSIIHNPTLRDRVVHIAYYAEGYRAVDLSDPRNPIEVGHYVTSPGTGAWSGAWGCYAGQPSGNVYISDTNRGLFVLRPAALGRRYGAATGNGSARPPSLHFFGAPWLGNRRFALQIDDAPAGAPALLLLGTAPANAALGSLRVLVELGRPGSPALLLPQRTDAGGLATWPTPVPTSASLLGASLYAQALVADPGTPGGIAGTRGVQLQPFAR